MANTSWILLPNQELYFFFLYKPRSLYLLIRLTKTPQLHFFYFYFPYECKNKYFTPPSYGLISSFFTLLNVFLILSPLPFFASILMFPLSNQKIPYRLDLLLCVHQFFCIIKHEVWKTDNQTTSTMKTFRITSNTSISD